MNNSYNQIANVTIDVATAIVDTTSFDNILIVGPAPAVAPSTAPPLVGEYSSLDEVVAAGWVATGAGADPVGVAARVAFSQNPAPSKIFIAPLQKVNTTVEEQTVQVDESPVSAVTRAAAVSGWYVVCPAGIAAASLTDLADYVETQEKMMVCTDTAFFGAGTNSADQAVINKSLDRTAVVFGRESSTQAAGSIPEENKYINVAFAVAWLANESGSETAAFKTLNSVKPADLSSTELNSLKTKHVSYLTTIGGKNVTMIGQVLSGEWCDVIRFRDWLKNDMQVSVASLFLAHPKIPFTDGGISLIQNAMEESLQRGQVAGGIAENSYDDDDNEILGYEIFVPDADSISDNDKASRVLAGCKFTAKLTGAIHYVDLKGSLAYSL